MNLRSVGMVLENTIQKQPLHPVPRGVRSSVSLTSLTSEGYEADLGGVDHTLEFCDIQTINE